MSAVSSSTSTPSPEPAASRRRAPEREADGEAAPFTLPGDAGADKKTAGGAAKAEAGGPSAEPGKAQAPKGPAAAPVIATQAAAAAGPGSVVSPPAEAKPEQAAPKQDAATLFAIAVAALGPGKDAEAEGKSEPAEAKEPVPDGQAAAVVEVAASDKAPAPVAAPVVPAPAVVAATIVTEAVDPVLAAKVAGGKAVAAPVQSPPVAGEKSAVAVTALPLPADAGAIAAPDEEAKPGEKLHPAVAGMARDAAVTVASPTAGAAAPNDVKPLEALQQVLAPIDLSALAQPRGGRPEGLPGQPDLAQAAAGAQSPATAQQRGAADGQPTPLHVVPIEIGLRALAGSKRFDIRLDPAELGRVDVNLEISEKGEVSARLVVDRVETLHLLQRDARTLERAFEQAGLKAADGGVDISLRDPADQSGFRQNRHEDEAPRRASHAVGEATEDSTIPAQPAPVRRLVRLGGVDLSI